MMNVDIFASLSNNLSTNPMILPRKCGFVSCYLFIVFAICLFFVVYCYFFSVYCFLFFVFYFVFLYIFSRRSARCIFLFVCRRSNRYAKLFIAFDPDFEDTVDDEVLDAISSQFLFQLGFLLILPIPLLLAVEQVTYLCFMLCYFLWFLFGLSGWRRRCTGVLVIFCACFLLRSLCFEFLFGWSCVSATKPTAENIKKNGVDVTHFFYPVLLVWYMHNSSSREKED